MMDTLRRERGVVVPKRTLALMSFQALLLAGCSLNEGSCRMPSGYEEAEEDFFALSQVRLEGITAAANRYVQRCYPTRPYAKLSDPSFVSARMKGGEATILIYDFQEVPDAFVAFEVDRTGSVSRAFWLRMS